MQGMQANAAGDQGGGELIIRPKGKRVLFSSEGLSKVKSAQMIKIIPSNLIGVCSGPGPGLHIF